MEDHSQKSEMLTPARWPNAKWSDKTVFLNSYWRPDGCCGDSERGRIVDAELAKADLDFTGAIAILNVGSFQSWAREVFIYDIQTGVTYRVTHLVSENLQLTLI